MSFALPPAMRKILLSLLMVTGCVVGTNTGDPAGGGADDDGGGSDDPQQQNPDPTQQRTCSLPETSTDAGSLAASKAQQCNVPGSGGAKKWYRVAAPLTGTMDFIQIELWDGRGAFAAGAVAPGTYQLTGAELSPTTCGICVRGLGDKGAATQKEYFATSGTVLVTSVGTGGGAVSVTLTNARFQEIDAAKAPVSGGCAAPVSNAKIDGTIVVAGGGGGGGGNCPATIGD
jgi:hypothetical protein